MIDVSCVDFSYPVGEGSQPAIRDLSLTIEKGQHVAVLGRNGSGKSTFARLLNGLLLPDKGQVLVEGLDTCDAESIWTIRRLCGMVFQNPDNQIVGTTVEDVAFGPENLGIASPEIRERVDQALAAVGLSAYAKRAPHQLSGGQKQKLAIAGILAMQPQYLILDEATAMLDPASSHDLLQLVETLRCERGLTVINITHKMSEAVLADHVFVLSDGRLVQSGTPQAVFCESDVLEREGLDVPVHMRIVRELAHRVDQSYSASACFSMNDAAAVVGDLLNSASDDELLPFVSNVKVKFRRETPSTQDESVVNVHQLSYTDDGTEIAMPALKNVSFDIKRGEFFSIAGHSGSGKSTLITHLNGLIRPQSGSVHVFGLDASLNTDIPAIRRRLSLLFQYPEHQLFEESVWRDVAFGPARMGVPEAELDERVREAIALVGLEPDILDRSPFELSGGQKRRVALAGILAMRPDALVLDEPAAGLDPIGRREILDYLNTLCNMGVTIVLVSHDMNELAECSDRILILDHGSVAVCDRPSAVFSGALDLQTLGLALPDAAAFLLLCNQISMHKISTYRSNAHRISVNQINTRRLVTRRSRSHCCLIA